MDDLILLIEADDVIRKHLAALLGQNGYRCRPVACLAAGLNELRQRRYPLVVLDPPGAAAPGLSRQFRSLQADIRLVCLDTAVESHGRTQPDGSFDAVIPKPFVFDTLLNVLADLLPSGSAHPGPLSC